MELRPYQVAAEEAIAREHQNVRSTLLVAATGTGKTVLFTDYSRRFRRTLVIAHRTDLLDQATKTIRRFDLTVNREQAESYARRHKDLWGRASNVVVASVQTLGKRNKEGEPYRLAGDDGQANGWPHDAFDLIIVDEAHRSVAKTYRTVLDWFPEAKVLGVTATPDRFDNVGLGNLFDSVAYRYEIRQGIDEGYLSPIKAKCIVVDELQLDGVPVSAGDFQKGALSTAMRNEAVLKAIAYPLLEMSEKRKTIAFGPTVEWAHELAAILNAKEPGVALALDGSIPVDDRQFALRADNHRILINCLLFTEGYDDPELSCVAVCRPTKSRAAYTQMVGRGTRPCPKCEIPITTPCEHKPDMLILDFTGVSEKHSLVGPADVLAGGDLEEDVAKKAREIMADSKGGEDVAKATEKAREYVRNVKLMWHARTVNPFAEYGDIPFKYNPYLPPATDGQINLLTMKGVEVAVLNQLNKGSAGRLIGQLKDRQRRGLCTWKQAKWIRKNGEDPSNMTFQDASAFLSKLFGR